VAIIDFLLLDTVFCVIYVMIPCSTILSPISVLRGIARNFLSMWGPVVQAGRYMPKGWFRSSDCDHLTNAVLTCSFALRGIWRRTSVKTVSSIDSHVTLPTLGTGLTINYTTRREEQSPQSTPCFEYGDPG